MGKGKNNIEMNFMTLSHGKIKTDSEKHRDLTKSQSIQFGTNYTKKGPGRYPVKAKQDR